MSYHGNNVVRELTLTKSIIAIFLVFIFFGASNANASGFIIENNSSSSVTLHDGDTIALKLPSDWGFTRIALGINSILQNKLSGQLVVNGCSHKLDDNYKLVDFDYRKEYSVKYRGPTQDVLIQGWVDSAPVTSECDSTEKESKEDSVWQAKKNQMNFLIAVRTSEHKDLGPLETETRFEGPSSFFKITELPEWNFNRVYVLVEPADGRKLNGVLYSGKLQRKLSGWSAKIPLSLKNDMPILFELAFPEFRKIKLKWWAALESPQRQTIKSVKKTIGSDSVEVTYTFDDQPHNNRNIKLRFRKEDFVDGKIPVVKKLDFNPDGVTRVDSLKSYDITSDIYEIQAKPRTEALISFALPLGSSFHPETDSVFLRHQMDGKWVEVPVDSVKNGFAYFKTNSFSLWEMGMNFITDGLTMYGCNITPASYFLESCRDASGNIVRGSATTLKHFYDKIVEFGVDAECVDLEGFKRLFGNEEKDEWDDVGAGSLKFNTINPNSDSGYKEILNTLISKRSRSLTKIKNACKDRDDKEVCEWQVTRDNLDILLADAIVAQRSGNVRRFTRVFYNTKNKKFFLYANNIPVFYNEKNEPVEEGPHVKNLSAQSYAYKDYFNISSDFVEYAGWFVSGLQKCLNVLNQDGATIQKWLDFKEIQKSYTSTCRNIFDAMDLGGENALEVIADGVNCTEFSAQKILQEYNLMEGRDDKLIAISEAMVRISLLAWLDKTVLRDFLHLAYQKTYDGIHEWLKLADPFLMRNNIVAKAYASLALYEYIFTGGESNLNNLNGALNKHYGPNGGYSEGMGYSQYIWDDVPYVLSALMDAYALKGESFKIDEKFLKSPDYIFDFSRPVGNIADSSYYGFIPVEIDDGCTYNPDYRIWAKLKNDSKYLAMSRYAPLRDDEKKNVLVPFGFPAQNVYDSKKSIPNRGSLWGSNQDGLLMITAVHGEGANADTVALSMVAENGDLWKNGQAHDQQDNLSITLSSNKDGFIIQDRGYSGFGKRKDKNFHRYKNHNVVIPKGYDQPDNERISGSEIRKRVQDFTQKFAGGATTSLPYLYLLFEGLFSKETDYSFALEGGAEASIEEHSIEDPRNGVVGYTASTSFDESIENHRSILYFGGSFWVIDRSNTTDLTWFANSPVDAWDKLNGIDLRFYGSSENEIKDIIKTDCDIEQHLSRIDFLGKKMKNFTYSYQDEKTNTFVMTYPIYNEGFIKVTRNCPTNCQCFENGAKDKRLIIPPLNTKFELCNALPQNECTNKQYSSAITMLVKILDNEWHTDIDMILDGQLTTEENGAEVELKSITVSRTKSAYVKLDNLTFSRKHRSSYLPANMILLRQ